MYVMSPHFGGTQLKPHNGENLCRLLGITAGNISVGTQIGQLNSRCKVLFTRR